LKKNEFFGVERNMNVTSLIPWKQGKKKPMKTQKPIQMVESSGGNSELQVARGSPLAARPTM